MKIETIRFEDDDYQSYNVLIGKKILPQVLEYVRRNIADRKIAIITDGNVSANMHAENIDDLFNTVDYVIETDENNEVESKKNIETYGKIINFLDENNFQTGDIILPVGGGVLGDLGTFVAATYKAGMNLVHAPTSTISQADASIGGKGSLNSDRAKNSVRTIYQPDLIAIDVSTLQTLEDRHYRSGLVESVKHALILDKNYFKFLKKEMKYILKRDEDVLEAMAVKNVQLKGSVVGKDPDEENYRRILNLGHTIGHAIEMAACFRLSHGEAVSLGLLAALHISNNIGKLPTKEFDQVQDLLINKLKMPDKVPNYLNKRLIKEVLQHDKKIINGVLQFVTIDEIGKVNVKNGQFAKPIPGFALEAALDYII